MLSNVALSVDWTHERCVQINSFFFSKCSQNLCDYWQICTKLKGTSFNYYFHFIEHCEYFITMGNLALCMRCATCRVVLEVVYPQRHR